MSVVINLLLNVRIGILMLPLVIMWLQNHPAANSHIAVGQNQSSSNHSALQVRDPKVVASLPQPRLQIREFIVQGESKEFC